MMVDGLKRAEGFFPTRRSLSLYYQRWTLNEDAAPCFIVHGGGEHSGRYSETAARLAQAGYAVYAMDLQGHGRSPGIRGHILQFDAFVEDVREGIQFASKEQGGLRPVLLGHSLGGLISTYYAVAYPETIERLVLTSPLWGLGMRVPWWKRAAAHGFASVWPSLTLGRPKTEGMVLSHDPQVVARYAADPLVHRKASVRLYLELLDRFKRLPDVLSHLRIPLLILQAGDDQIASAEAVRRLYPFVESPHKRLTVYEGYYHEVLNETGRDRVFQDLIEWLRSDTKHSA